jgi:hypothetical protein
MKIATKLNGVAIAAAAAAVFAMAPLSVSAADAGKAGHCMGANACKGQGACKTANNACKGQNACKGKGVMEMSKEDCAKAKGKFEAAPAEKKS